MRQTTKKAFTLVELLVVIAIIGTLVGLLLPAVNAAREAARSNTCKNNLRQLQTAVALYETSLKHYPGYMNKLGVPGAPPEDQTRASWVVMIMPYMEQEPLYQSWADGGIDGNGDFSSLETLICPSDPPDTVGEPILAYVANAGYIEDSWENFKQSAQITENAANGVFFDRTRQSDGAYDGRSALDDARDNAQPQPAGAPMITMSSASIKDGATRTLMLTENRNATHWGHFGLNNEIPDQKYYFGFCWEQPAVMVSNPASPRRINGSDDQDDTLNLEDMDPDDGFPSSYHPGGVNAAFVGGNVTFLNEQIEPLIYAQLMTSNFKRSDLKNPAGTLYERDESVPQPSDDKF